MHASLVHLLDHSENTNLYYDIHGTKYGEIILFTTQNAICGLHFLTAPLTDHLALAQKRLNPSELIHAPKQSQSWWQRIIAPQAPLPIALQGTPFQKKVWTALCTIPSGQTCSYQALAGLLGIPASVRAVANAVAKNFISCLVPCHRIIGKNNQLTGYRWGIAKKAALLKDEQAGKMRLGAH